MTWNGAKKEVTSSAKFTLENFPRRLLKLSQGASKTFLDGIVRRFLENFPRWQNSSLKTFLGGIVRENFPRWHRPRKLSQVASFEKTFPGGKFILENFPRWHRPRIHNFTRCLPSSLCKSSSLIQRSVSSKRFPNIVQKNPVVLFNACL